MIECTVLKPEEWPYTNEYLVACELAMERLGIQPESYEPSMRALARTGKPLYHLLALENWNHPVRRRE